jgi:hypothetical protein
VSNSNPAVAVRSIAFWASLHAAVSSSMMATSSCPDPCATGSDTSGCSRAAACAAPHATPRPWRRPARGEGVRHHHDIGPSGRACARPSTYASNDRRPLCRAGPIIVSPHSTPTTSAPCDRSQRTSSPEPDPTSITRRPASSTVRDKVRAPTRPRQDRRAGGSRHVDGTRRGALRDALSSRRSTNGLSWLARSGDRQRGPPATR